MSGGWEGAERDGRPCRVRTTGSVEERVYTDSGGTAGWRYAATLGHARVTPAHSTTVEPVPPAIAGGERAPTKLEPIRAQTGNSGIEIRLAREAIDTICQTCYWGNLDHANLVEVGGWLTGTGLADGAVHIGHATSATKESSARRVLLDIDNLRRLDFLRTLGAGLGCVGSWHLHVGGSYRASAADFQAWESIHEYVNEVRGAWEPAIVSIIAGPDDDGSFAYPQLAAWTTVKEDGRYVSRPATIVRADAA